MKYITICVLLVSIIGCKGQSTIPPCTPLIVNVPVYSIPDNIKAVPLYERPTLNIEYLTDKDFNDFNKIIESMNVTILQLQRYSEQLESNELIYRNFVNSNTSTHRE